jgi:ferredoxin
MKRADYETCAYCPKLCRHVCPVAVGTARESTTPTAMMTGALLALDGIVTPAEGYASASLCTSCGACTEVCLLDQPVREHGPQRAIEISRHDAIEAASLLHFADEGPAMAFALDEGEQHLEDQRLERLPARRSLGEGGGRRTLGAMRHGSEATIDLILVSI